MAEQRYMPDTDRISVLLGVVLLAFAFTRLIPSPQYTLEMQLPSIYLSWKIDLYTISTILAATLTATGMDWLLRGHTALQKKGTEKQPTYPHWLLPTLTTFIIGTALSLLPDGNSWWLGFGIAALLLLIVFTAEYVVVEPADVRYATATVIISAISYAIFLILVIALRYADIRLYILIPVMFISSSLMTLRILNLRLSGHWEFGWAIGISLIVIQLSAAWHYWPLTPVQYGLLVLGPLYALTSIAGNLIEDVADWRTAIEPAIMLMVMWALAFWFR